MRDNFEICPVCGWEDDGVQNDDPAFWGGANTLSLNLSKKIWAWQKPVECPLCGYKTLTTGGANERCPICGWIDDPSQSENSENANGANPMSLDFANAAWHEGQSFGLLKGEGWDESIDSERVILTLEADRKFPLELQECPCCGTKSLLVRNENLYCDVCEWTDDPAQSNDPNLENGANATSLNQARAIWEQKRAQEVVEQGTENIAELTKTAI